MSSSTGLNKKDKKPIMSIPIPYQGFFNVCFCFVCMFFIKCVAVCGCDGC